MAERSPSPLRLLIVAGTRPDYMKAAAVAAAVDRWNKAALFEPGVPRVRVRRLLAHVGRPYDEKTSRLFFDDLGLPRPDRYLGVGPGSLAEQTAAVMLALEPLMKKGAPDLVLVAGEDDSATATALFAARSGIPVAHVEAGVRNRDLPTPQEPNRPMLDRLCELLFTGSIDAGVNLAAEGIPAGRVRFVGSTMVDILENHRMRALDSPILGRFGLGSGGYAVVALQHPSHVHDQEGLDRLVHVLWDVALKIPVIFPVHNRTRDRLIELGLDVPLRKNSSIVLCGPLGYLDFLGLLARARVALTDATGTQEQTTVLGVPCLTLRTNTEVPVTVTEGTNRLVDPGNQKTIVAAVAETLAAPMPVARRPKLWDGHAGDRVVNAIAGWKVARRAD
ncbi:MAG: UDP-N-acetylglucosamine 2-epimerase [Thermoleophilia bacterium]|nr:UDP-N-acetylglucosamine 2-epimerase [Thermoleophilia bacterium]